MNVSTIELRPDGWYACVELANGHCDEREGLLDFDEALTFTHEVLRMTNRNRALRWL